MFNQTHVQRLQAAAAARLNKFHRPKHQLLGNKAIPAPAWKLNVVGNVNNANSAGARKGKEVCSKILLSQLPVDVPALEVEDLFKKTVGPLKDMFLVCNSQGKSKGMAVVTFARPGDAAIARQKYNGKVVDGRRALKVEIVYDGIPGPVDQAPPVVTPALLGRLGGRISDEPTNLKVSPSKPALTLQERTQPPVVPPRRIRYKKGPKRLKKKQLAANNIMGRVGGHVAKASLSKDDLDKEMEDYRAGAIGIAV
ncbi:hypothetical protein AGABI1DRAFT_115612 [Agaricus bisporus var. burnettii JB137-S8]|uniref:RRM domain-containing protein n=1 Tax=Agaricus bisporus var. burnettii (strain JB137-S8 / ATCC MYA-4627 / FGSC 10392) TaxID=597362 RepID=K5VQI3_AGABU|nr:uncharacterized protein AGABI1DRAFT_115612 [Agaricus bisporus var. burnettii JB137-S8]EKM76724.1 hypothetical protein AGABI1DRAFT_115612 [Agaricus bisporus var. burnettii JB137-S8]